MKIVGTKSDRYHNWYSRQGMSRNNGAYWYAKEIEDIILPSLNNLNLWINTVGSGFYQAREVPDRAVIVCHDNIRTLKSYMKFFGKKILWVCSKQSSATLLSSKGENAIYIPLSIDVEYVEQFKRKRRTKDIAYVGNAWGFKKEYLSSLPSNIVQLNGMDRDDLLKEMSKYRTIIAEGRCLMEAKVLGAKTELPTHGYGDIVDREVIDSRQVIEDWRTALESHQAESQYCIMEVMRTYRDLEAGINRRYGDIFFATKQRAEELLSNKMEIVKLI